MVVAAAAGHARRTLTEGASRSPSPFFEEAVADFPSRALSCAAADEEDEEVKVGIVSAASNLARPTVNFDDVEAAAAFTAFVVAFAVAAEEVAATWGFAPAAATPAPAAIEAPAPAPALAPFDVGFTGALSLSPPESSRIASWAGEGGGAPAAAAESPRVALLCLVSCSPSPPS